MSNNPGLGRGLGSLIPNRLSKAQKMQAPKGQSYSYAESKERIQLVPVRKIQPNPRQPRNSFPVAGLEDLVESIREHGILQPLIVTQVGSAFQLVAGERRFRAAKMLDLKTVPCIVRTATDQQKLELALVENVQREDLNPLEEAAAYKQMIDEFSLTQEEAAKKVGKKRSTIANSLRLLNLPVRIQEALQQNKITVGHAKVLMEIDDQAKQLLALKQIVSQGFSVKETDSKFTKTVSRKAVANPQVAVWEEELRNKLATKVAIQKKGQGGKIIIEYYSPEELKSLINKLT